MTALGGEKAYFTQCQILASKDRWEMNAAHLVLRLNKCFFFFLFACVCVYRHTFFWILWVQTRVIVRVFFFVCLCASVKAPASPWLCLLITQICTQSEEIMNESFNYASRQRIPDASATPLAHCGGWGQVKQEPFPPGSEIWSALNADRAYKLTWRQKAQTLEGRRREECKMDSLIKEKRKKMSYIGLLSLTDMTQPLISGDPWSSGPEI